MEIDNHENNRQRGNPRWVKGQSGNLKGRPRKEVCLTSQLKELLLEIPQIADPKTGEINQRTGIELIALAWFRGLLRANPVLLKEALERIEGKVKQPLEHTGAGGRPIKIEVVSPKAKELTQRLIDGE